MRQTDAVNGFSGRWEGNSMDVTRMIAELRSELEEIDEEISLLERLDSDAGQPLGESETVN